MRRMISSTRLKTILTLALPIIGGMLSQNIMNLVDTLMVGTLGNAALAAVGIGGFAHFTCSAFIIGLGASVQAMSARRHGQGHTDQSALPLNGGLLLALLIGLPLSIICYSLTPLFYPLLNSDPLVFAEGVPYLQIRLLSMVGVGMNFAFRGFWNGIGLSKIYMKTLIVVHSSNILISYVLIFGKLGFPALGTFGAGLGTTIATYLGSFYYLIQALGLAKKNGFFRKMPSLNSLNTLLRLAIPSGIQQFFFAAGLTAFFWIIGRIGTPDLAAASVLVNIMLVAILPGVGFGLAAASLVGHALGRDDPKDAKQWAWDTVKVGMISLTIIGLPMILGPHMILGAFIHNPQTLDLAQHPLQITGITIFIEAIGLVLMHALLGAGDNRRVMIAAIVMQWFFFLPLAYFIGPLLGFGLIGVWIMQSVYRGVQAFVFAYLWHQEKWNGIRV